MNLGFLIRQNRKKQKLTLKDVSQKAGISEGFLSQVENSVNSPSVDTLMKICNALGVNAGDILNQVSDPERLVIIRKKDWPSIDVPHTGFATRRFLSPENKSVIDSALLIIEPGKSIPARKGTKNQQEVLCVLQGTLEVNHSAGVFTLMQGDALHLWSDNGKQKVTNTGKKSAVALWVGTI
jgi:transcriptional regulator with XRE-family HTH domain